ncbi:MAG TPA: rod shape-determining protein [Deltaproteobacteria bacterium]|nr:rod shape-determining protein [Deltaproteobacteria bacterium]
MLNAMLGLFSQDLAVDLGTSNTRVYLRGTGVVCDEPTVVSVQTDRDGRRRVTAIGSEALPMLGRTPEDIHAIQPIRAGRILDFEVAEAFLLHLVRRAHGRNGWMRPRMVVAVPHHASDMEARAVRDSCESAGAREVHLVPRPIAAAVGASLPVQEPDGTLIVDVGGGSTEISLLALSGVVLSRVVPGGGEGMDAAIIQWLQRERRLLVGRPSAERLKIALGTASHPDPSATSVVKGRCLERGIPRSETVSAADIASALAPHVEAIAVGIRNAISEAPPELGSDVVDQGVVLTGGGSLLRDLDLGLRDLTGLPVIRAEDPEQAVAHGVGGILEDTLLQHAVALAS